MTKDERKAEVDRIVERELERRMREASYYRAGFPRETWSRTYGAA